MPRHRERTGAPGAVAALFLLVHPAPVIAQGLLIEQVPTTEPSTIIDLTTPSQPQPRKKVAAEQRTGWTVEDASQDWRFECRVPNEPGAERQCRIASFDGLGSQTEKLTGAKPFQMSVRLVDLKKGASPVPVAIVLSPMNILLPKGLALKIDQNRSFKLVIRSCHVDLSVDGRSVTTACLAPFRLRRSIRNSMMRGNKLVISAEQLDGKPTKATISLLGFTKMLAKLQP